MSDLLAEGSPECGVCLEEKTQQLAPVKQVTVFGIPLAQLDFQGALDRIDDRIRAGQPGFFITANLNYAMLSDRDPRLADVNRAADFICADGMPMVWHSRLLRRPLPERVTGADLVEAICRQGAPRGYRVFFLGGAPGIAQAAAESLAGRYPGLQIAGIESPHMGSLSDGQRQELIGRIRQSRADVLFVALGQPKGELWLAAHYRELGVPVSVQIGASLDFAAGKVKRAPCWAGRFGLEWLVRLLHEPRRLGPRYFGNAVFLAKAVVRDWWGGCFRDKA
jgi:N-acetylglucosaminyldiphosphoundecaprenol N-acetyl-beta-D-mannosaminyltransferase